MMPQIFKNPDLQQQFNRDGFIVLPFLSADEVKLFNDLFYKLHPQVPQGFYSSVFSSDSAYKRTIADFTENIYSEKVDSLFSGIKKLGAAFLCKSSGEGKMPAHQDYTVVDESKFCSVTIWVPLVDTNESNGAIRFVRGSHQLIKTLRSPNIPRVYEPVQDEIWNEMETLPMKAGEAFIFNHALFHASFPNATSKERVIITYGLTPEEAELFVCLKNERGRVDKYKMPDDMFLRYNNVGARPAFGEKIEEFDYDEQPLSSFRLQHLLNSL